MTDADPCQSLRDEVATIEQAITDFDPTIDPQGRLPRLRRQLINAEKALVRCEQHPPPPPPPQPPPRLATFFATATVQTDNSNVRGPLTEPGVNLPLTFDHFFPLGDGVNGVLLGFADLIIPTKDGPLHVTKVGGGLGSFDPATGSLTVPITLHVDGLPLGLTLNLDFSLSTEQGQRVGPFVAQGSRLTQTGALTLAGAAHDTLLGEGVNVLLTLDGVVSPHP